MSQNITQVVKNYFKPYLSSKTITEICYNGGDTLFVMDKGMWFEFETKFSVESLIGFSQSVAKYSGKTFDKSKPILSASLPTKERVQFVRDPAMQQGSGSLTIRVPNRQHIAYEAFAQQGFFTKIGTTGKANNSSKTLQGLYETKKYKEFIAQAVREKQTIVISGATGTGKTAFMKSLLEYIGEDERLISIEDVDEIQFFKHKNTVKLFYPEGATPDDFLHSGSLLKSCKRMRPERILLAEVRGGEAFDFIKVVTSGHEGSITSCHAGSIDETFDALALMILENPQGQKIPYETIIKILKQSIDVVVHAEYSKETDERYITDIYYKGEGENR
jgi:type IV secretion system protein VirB11